MYIHIDIEYIIYIIIYIYTHTELHNMYLHAFDDMFSSSRQTLKKKTTAIRDQPRLCLHLQGQEGSQCQGCQ